MLTETPSKLTKICLWAAGALSTSMALFHFLLPYVYPWEQRLEGLYPPVQWAVFAINFSYSSFLLWGSLLTIAAAMRRGTDRWFSLWIVGGMAVIWAAGAVYEFLVPFPVAVARWVLPVFALVLAVLYGVAFVGRKAIRQIGN